MAKDRFNPLFFSLQVHPSYKAATFQNDLALIRLSKDVTYKEHIIPVCLPPPKEDFVGTKAVVIGWGRTAHGQVGGSYHVLFSAYIF